MDKLGENLPLSSIELAESNLDDLPLNCYGRRGMPLEFVLQVLEVVVLGGSVTESCLKASDNYLTLDTKAGVTGSSLWI